MTACQCPVPHRIHEVKYHATKCQGLCSSCDTVRMTTVKNGTNITNVTIATKVVTVKTDTTSTTVTTI